MKIFLFLIGSLILSSIYTTDTKVPNPSPTENLVQSIDFLDLNYQEAINRAKLENKPVFIGFYTTWCAACQTMRLRVYKNNEVGELFNASFINLHINGDKGDGVALAEQLEVSGFPTLLFISPDGEIIGRFEGFHNAEALLKVASVALDKWEQQS